MFDTTFTHQSATPLPPSISLNRAVEVLHDFDTIIRFSPDCRGATPIPTPSGKAKPGKENQQWWEVEDDLPFIPKKLWTGGVKYNAIFEKVSDGCDITIMAPGGFTSVNHWRLLHQSEGEHHTTTTEEKTATNGTETPKARPGIARKETKTRDLLHAGTTGGGWYVQIISDAKCPKMYVSFVKGFLRNSHVQLQRAFIDRLQHDQDMDLLNEKLDSVEILPAEETGGRTRRPTLGRRRSSVF